MTDFPIIPLFPEMSKVYRLSREMIVTEKLDGTNASIYIPEDGGPMLFGSRTKWITPADDNFGFARWATEHHDELLLLGPGHHFGEWWGQGIQRNYDLKEKRFSLFNTSRWSVETDRPTCCGIVPVLYQGPFDTATVDARLLDLSWHGSIASPGFMKPEGVVVYHVASRQLFKKTLDKNDGHKGA